MATLERLKGTNGQPIECVFVHKGYKIREVLKNKLAATSAGDRGAINIYRDDAGAIRCVAMKYCQTVDEQTYTNIKSAIKWTNEWLKLIN